MGLDWCIQDKTIEGHESRLQRLLSVRDNLSRAEDRKYEKWLSEEGHTKPFHFPNPITDKWMASSEGVACYNRRSMIDKEIAKCVITPMQTLGAPKVGESEAADNHLRSEWMTYSDLQEQYPTVEEYLEAARGKYVPEMVKSDGLPKVSGMMAGAESFRGKVIGYIEWLPEDIRNSAYDNMSPDELVEYGQDLLDWVDVRLAAFPECSEMEVVEAAGKWCVFWGSRGHSMFAWY